MAVLVNGLSYYTLPRTLPVFVDNCNSEVFSGSHEVGCVLSPYPRVRKRTRLRGDCIFFPF
jgi:hypothetical protein